MKVLMIEDNPDDIAGIIDYCKGRDWDVNTVKDFKAGLSEIGSFDPDAIVLDLQNKEDATYPGATIIDLIWKEQFRPVCVFSGQIVNASVERDAYPSPLTCFIDKGDEKPVIEFLDKIEPYIASIREMQRKTHDAYKHSFDVLEYIFNDKITDCNVIAYLFHCRMRDRFSAELDDSLLPAWGQYIIPPATEHFLTGDIVCLQDELNKPFQKRKYSVILSQSCDMAHKGLKNIIIANCIDKKTAFEKLSLPTGHPSRLKEKLTSVLNSGFHNNIYFLPELFGVLPNLFVDLKDVSIIKIEKLTCYKKVASLNSPYRERLVWAFMQNACRPGVPSLDVQNWAKCLCAPESDVTNKNEQC